VSALAGAAVQVAGHGWWAVLAIALCVLVGLAANAVFVENTQARRLNAMGLIVLGVLVVIGVLLAR